jgi:RNase adaptor protein for sRNA GlmZ degradation
MPDLMKDLSNATTNFVNGTLDNLKSMVDKTAEELKTADMVGMTRSVLDSTIDNTKNVIDRVSETRANDPLGMAKNLLDSSLEATKNVLNTVAEETKRADVIGTVNRVAQKGFDVIKEQTDLSIDTTRKVADTLKASAPKMNTRPGTVTKVEIETETKKTK